MFERFLDSIFGWQVEPPPIVVPEPLAPPRMHPERQLLRLLGVGSFEQLEADAQVRAEHGIPPGGVVEVKNVAGYVTGYRPKQFASMAEAAVAAKIDLIDDPELAAEAKRLQPLVRRWSLKRQLDALKVAT